MIDDDDGDDDADLRLLIESSGNSALVAILVVRPKSFVAVCFTR